MIGTRTSQSTTAFFLAWRTVGRNAGHLASCSQGPRWCCARLFIIRHVWGLTDRWPRRIARHAPTCLVEVRVSYMLRVTDRSHLGGYGTLGLYETCPASNERREVALNGSQLTHVVAFTLKPGVSREDPQAQVAAAITDGHPAAIPEIATWACGWDISRRSDSADFLVVSTFDTAADYETFQTHPDHQLGKDAWKRIATWTVADILPGGDERS